jgi:hypothetical protein
MVHHGSCHCGRVAFQVDADLDEVIDCSCSHCRRKGYLLAFVPGERFALGSPDAPLFTYTFNRHAIRHRFCEICGCAPFGEGAGPGGTPMIAINVRCLPDVDLAALRITPVDGKAL